jgi:long-chain fatty acid transport protein
MRTFVKLLIICCFLTHVHSFNLYANGFRILGIKGTKATSMGEAFTAQADDPSAVAFNPAGMTQLDGTWIQQGFSVVNSYTDHTSPSGIKEEIQDEWQLVPNLFVTSDLGLEKWTFGVGLSVPNGISSSWREDSLVRYVNTFSDLLIADVNVAAAYPLTDQLSIGGGFSYYYSEATLRNKVDFGLLAGAPGAFDGNSRLFLKGDTCGWDIGLLFKLNEQHQFGFFFKSEFDVEFDDGKLQLTNIPPFLGLGSSITSSAKTELEIPGVLVFGYAFKPMENLKLEFDLDWTMWETLDVAHVDVADPLQDIDIIFNYDNAFAYKFGVEYLWNPRTKLRAGYIYNEQAIPDDFFRPSIPETTTHLVSCGVGLDVGRHWIVDLGAQVILYEDRTVNNNVDNNETTSSSSVDGLYESIGFNFMLTATYRI